MDRIHGRKLLKALNAEVRKRNRKTKAPVLPYTRDGRRIFEFTFEDGTVWGRASTHYVEITSVRDIEWRRLDLYESD